MNTTDERIDNNATSMLIKRLDIMKSSQKKDDDTSDYIDFVKHAKAMTTNDDLNTIDLAKFANWMKSSFTSLFSLLLRISAEKVNIPEYDLTFLRDLSNCLLENNIDWNQAAKHFVEIIEMDIYNAIHIDKNEKDESLYEFTDCEEIYVNWHNAVREMVNPFSDQIK